ncbi:MAG: Uncharacterised protein [Cryomorphaceae bacterium]|nr:DUF2147 domain-containing protein [Cryomorphaceae bacterium]CAI8162382.1 MAG: Uncharacterised protein [Cryomorphaceae bacterium]
MRKAFILLALFISLTALSQNEIVGTWDTGREKSIVEIYEDNGELFGKIISSDRAEVVGKINLKNLQNKGDHWEGELFVFKRRSWYDVAIHKENETLFVVISIGFFEKEVEWPKG